MEDYPDFGVFVEGYDPARSDGAEALRAEDGTVWVYRAYDQEQLTFTITHPAMLWEDEETLRQFYADNKNDVVRFYDPRSKQHYAVLMLGPPRLVGMRSGIHADIEMVLAGVAA